MAVTNEDFIIAVEKSRAYLLRHLQGLTLEQLDWKPYRECKNVIETIQHLIVDDRTALESMKTMSEPDYDDCVVDETDYDRLLEMLDQSHRELIQYLRQRFADQPLDALGCSWGAVMPSPLAISHLSAEDYFHAGQISFIRLATDPAWDYYGAIYGISE